MINIESECNIEAKNMELLYQAIGDGVSELNSEERKSLKWLARWERSTIENLISAFQKAK